MKNGDEEPVMWKIGFLRKRSVCILGVIVCIFLMTLTEVRAADDDKEKLKEYIISEMWDFTEKINTEDQSFDEDALFETTEEMAEFLRQCRYCVDNVGSYQYTFTYYKDICRYRLCDIIPEYNCKPEDMRRMQEEAGKLLEGLSDDRLSDVQKALLVHDRLIANCEYYYQADGDEEYSVIHRAYGAIVNKSAVCAGYAKAYRYLLEQLGIRCEYIISKELDHAWNIVYIDDVPYHVDTTWDDLKEDVVGYVKHENFLVSSKKFYERGHEADDYNTLPNSTQYDNYFWVDTISEFQLLDGKIYYIDRDDAVLKVWANGRHRKLCSVADKWKKHEERLNFSLLANDGEEILYSISDAIYSYNTDTCKSKLVYQPEGMESAEQSIYGFTYADGEYICELSDEPPAPADKRRVEKMPETEALNDIAVVILAVFMGIISTVDKKIRSRKKGIS